MNGLELRMNQRDAQQRRQRRRRIGGKKSLQIREQFGKAFGRRRNESGVAPPGAADPVLRTAQFTRLLVVVTRAVEQ